MGAAVARRNGARVFGVHAELHAGTPLLGSAFIQGTPRFEAFRTRRKIERNDAIRMRADAVLNDLACAAQLGAAGIRIHTHIAPAALRGLPFDLGEFFLAAISQDETRLGPVRPVGGEAVATICDDEVELLCTLK